MDTEGIRRSVEARLKDLKWSRARLARESGADPNTISDFLNGKRRPSSVTLAKLETALGLTPGTLADGGEEPDWVSGGRFEAVSNDLSRVGNDELIGELSERIRSLQRRVRELEPLAERERAREAERQRFLNAVTEDSPEEDQWIAHERLMLAYASSDDGDGWGPEEEARDLALDARLDALIYERRQERDRESAGPVPLHRRRVSPPKPRGRVDPKLQRMIEDAQEVSEAAYDGDADE